MREFVRAGAPEEILYVSKPHIGTFRLTGVVAAMRAEIIALGGEVRFESKVADLRIDDGQVEGVVLESGETLPGRHVVLALGHSARDTFRMLDQGVAIEPKAFSIGFRIEHPQSLIDKRTARPLRRPRGCSARPTTSSCTTPQRSRGLQLLHVSGRHRGGRHLGGGRVVTNGMSQYSRNEHNANAGIVVAINPEADYPGGPLAGVALQERLETVAFELGGSDYGAPGQLVGDFLQGVPSRALGEIEPSYKPGVRLGDLAPSLPDYAIDAIREALPAFGRQIRGFDRADAVFTGVETRTSSPLRITRDDASLQSRNVRGLYPCGEGAGYAGGILSAGVDGIRVAEAVARSLCRRRRRRSVIQAVWRHEVRGSRKLHQKKYRDEFGYYLIEGEHLVQELQKAASQHPRLLDCELYVTARIWPAAEPVRDARDQRAPHGADHRDARSPGHRGAGADAAAGGAARR